MHGRVGIGFFRSAPGQIPAAAMHACTALGCSLRWMTGSWVGDISLEVKVLPALGDLRFD